jgi:hypothetical protein
MSRPALPVLAFQNLDVVFLGIATGRLPVADHAKTYGHQIDVYDAVVKLLRGIRYRGRRISGAVSPRETAVVSHQTFHVWLLSLCGFAARSTLLA